MPRLILLNNALLLLCCSILVGTAAAMLLLDLPLDPAGDEGAARLLTILAIAMLGAGLLMLLCEWFTGIRLVPILVLLALAAWAFLVFYLLHPARGGGDLARAENSAYFLAGLWALQWAAMAYWFCRLASQARADR